MNKLSLFLMVAGLAIVTIAQASNSSNVLLRNAELSYWTKNVSESSSAEEPGDFDEMPEIAIAGSTVHVLWLTTKADYSGNLVYYRRSTDGGKTFQPKIIVARDDSGSGGTWGGATSKRMAVDGDTVHIALIHNSTNVIYYRSTDNGASFEPERILFSEGESSDGTSSDDIKIDASSGNVTIAWRRGRGTRLTDVHDSSVVTLSSNDNGATFNSTTVVFDPHNNGLEAQDVKRVGNNVYVLYTDTFTIPEGPDAGALTTSLGFAVSTNGGMSFASQVISEPAGNGYPQTSRMQDEHYVPKMAVVGDNISVTWVGLDGDDVMSLFYRRSTDNGVTFEPTVNLSRNALPAERTPRWGLETIAAKANYVYVVFVTSDAWIYMRRSTDGGATFQDLQLLSAPSGVPYIGGGWWPVVQTGPTDPTGATVHVLWTKPTYVYSSDGGATLTGPVLLSPQFSWIGEDPRRPHMAIGDDGAVHWVAAGSLDPCCPDSDIFYRRFEPNPPAPSADNMALSLVSNRGSDGDERYDNMQVPASSDINFTSAMTVEAWIKPNKGGSAGYFVYKADPGEGGAWGSYMLGQWRTGQADARITTTDGGFVLVAGHPIPNGEWSHVAMTYDANAGADNFRLYVNGILAGSMTATGTLKTNKGILFVGGDRYNRYYDDVTIDELRLWNRALTASDILANMEHTLQGDEPGLAAYYSFDGTTLDMTGHGNDGVLMYKESFVEGVSLGGTPPA